MSPPQPLTSLCSAPQRLADAAENFQKAHRWQDNIKVRAAPSPAPRTCPPPARVAVNAGEAGGRLPRRTGGAQGLCGVEPGALPSIRQTFEALLGAGTQSTDTNLPFHSRGAVEPPCEACSEAMLPTWVVQEVPDSLASPQGKEAP